MRYVVVAFAMFSFLALGSCINPAEDCGDGQEEEEEEEVPDVCKDYCSEYHDCAWDDYGGDEKDDAKNDSEDECVASCAWDIDHGMYVVEYDYDSDEHDFVGKVSGSTFEEYLECIFDHSSCNNGFWGLEYDDEDDCEDLAECVEILDIDLEYEWSDYDDYCDQNGDEGLW